MKEYTRKELLEICEKAFVKEEKWRNRYSFKCIECGRQKIEKALNQEL